MLGTTPRVAYLLCRIARLATRGPRIRTLPVSTERKATISTSEEHQENMFQRAVANARHTEKPPQKPTGPAISSSKTSTQANIQTAFQGSQAQRSSYLAAGGSQVSALKTSRPQSLNQTDPFTSSSSKENLPSPPLSAACGYEESSGERKDKLINAFDNASAFQENTSYRESSVALSTNSMASLHEAVYFDEDDFDDDIDLSLDFDVDQPVLPPALKAAVARLPKQAVSSLPAPPATPTHLKAPDSSAPLPWSSSPVPQPQSSNTSNHPNCSLVYSQDFVTREKKSNRISRAAKPEEPTSRLVKVSRHLPWLAKKEEEFCEEIEIVEATTWRMAQRTKTTANALETPHKGPKMPWNITASALKANRQEIKGKAAVQKRTMSTSTYIGEPEPGLPLKKLKMDHPAEIFFSEEQRKVIHMVTDLGQSVFFTGSAGTGKSVLLRELIKQLRIKYAKEPDRVAVTASTGLAACNIGGVTLHSFSGIGLGKEPSADLVRKIKKNAKAKGRWLRTKVLIIDEISMVDGDLFDKLEAIARQLKNNGRPFGGIQLVITGDFFQLPPVSSERGKSSKFAFEASTWGTSIEHTIGLTHVYRQRDAVFAEMLNELRLGKPSNGTIIAFRTLSRPIHYGDGIEATELFSTRTEVDAANNAKMQLLAGKVEIFDAVDSGTILDKGERDRLLNNCMAPKKIELKKHAQVMLIKNINETLVNGSLGRVVGFMTEKTFELLDNEDSLDGYEGTDAVEGEEEDAITKRQKRLKAQLTAIAAADTARKWPLVQFAIPDGTTKQLLVQPEQWKVELPNGEIQASRTQLPLILAWALSIHKAQGQTLERVKVDLGRVFEKGQAYVALSRATCQEGLQVLRFDATKVMAHEKVRAFYASLYSALEVGKKVGVEKTLPSLPTPSTIGLEDTNDGNDDLPESKHAALGSP